MRHLTGLADLSSKDFLQLLARAIDLKTNGIKQTLKGKHIAHIFDKSSLRTRTSMDVASFRLGAKSSFFSIDDDFWPVDFGESARPQTSSSGAESVKDFAPVLSSYYDCIGARISDGYGSIEHYLKDFRFREFVKYSKKPVINLNSSMEHPLQGLADAMTIQELGQKNSGDIVFTWVPNSTPRGWASSQSALIGAAHLGRNVILCHPEGYALSDEYMKTVNAVCSHNGTSFEVRHKQDEALKRASIVYAKSWIAPANFGNTNQVFADYQKYHDWHLTLDKLTTESAVLHPLPATRNVELLDEIMDHFHVVMLQQAGNKVYSNAAALEYVLEAEVKNN